MRAVFWYIKHRGMESYPFLGSKELTPQNMKNAAYEFCNESPTFY